MEHFLRRIFLTTLALFLLMGCEKPLENPESVDPIFLDINKDADNASKGIEEKRKEAQALQEQIEKGDADVIVQKHNQQLLYLAQKTITLMEQDLAYFKLRATTRKALDRDRYPAIFKNKGKWPDTDEFERYQAEKRLKEASRNWNDRVPKMPSTEKKSEAPAEAKSEAKPHEKASADAAPADK